MVGHGFQPAIESNVGFAQAVFIIAPTELAQSSLNPLLSLLNMGLSVFHGQMLKLGHAQV